MFDTGSQGCYANKTVRKYLNLKTIRTGKTLRHSVKLMILKCSTVQKVARYAVSSGPYFCVFGLNTGKYGPERFPYLDTFHAVQVLDVVQLKIKHQVKEKYKVVPVICSSLKNQNISTVKQNLQFNSELYFADFEDDETTHE